MANNCQMMCVIKTESMLWSLRSHPSSGELISYVNERQSQRSWYPICSRVHARAFRSCLGSKRTLPDTSSRLKKKSLAGFDERASHTQLLPVKNPSGDGRGWPPTQRDSHSAINPLPFRGQGPGGRKHSTNDVDLYECPQTWLSGRVCTLGSPANDLKSILEMIHSTTTRQRDPSIEGYCQETQNRV